MSTNTSGTSNRWVVPVVAVVVVVAAAFLVTRFTGGDDKPSGQPTATATPTSVATPKVTLDHLKGSGSAPKAIAISEATIARSTTGLGLAATIPKMKVASFESISLFVTQGSKDYTLSVSRDARGDFITPELQEGGAQLACGAAAFRAAGTRLQVTLPLRCLDKPTKALTAHLEIKDTDGGTEKTDESKSLKQPAS